MKKYRDASNRLTFDFSEFESSMYSEISESVVSKFNLEQASEVTLGLDEIFQKFKKGNDVVSLEWDVWSGYIVVACNAPSELLVQEIAIFINEQFNV
jgi:hypothetical protein